MKIKYTDKDGKTYEIKMSSDQENVEIEVSKEFFEAVKEFEEETNSQDRRETRYHLSADWLESKGYPLPDYEADPFRQLIKEEKEKSFDCVFDKLLPRQRELVERVVFDGVSITQIAREDGVSEGAVRHRLTRIYEQLKKHL